MGNGPSGTRFQDEPQCEVFFKEGFGRLTSLTSLFNVCSNTYKVKNDESNLKLTPEQRAIIAPAIEQLLNKYKESNRIEDVKALEENVVLNKHYMSILAFYKIKNEDGNTVIDKSLEEKVNTMSKLTKETNEILHSKIKDMKHTKN
jgi:hypothetical protein